MIDIYKIFLGKQPESSTRNSHQGYRGENEASPSEDGASH